MKWARHQRIRVVLVFLAMLAVAAMLTTWLGRILRDGRRASVLVWSSSPQPVSAPSASYQPQPQVNSASPLSSPPIVSSPGTTSSTPDSNPPQSVPQPSAAPGSLLIPVAGVRPDQLLDTFADARSEGRVHDAIDIPAPRGTAVLAAADGNIVKLFHSDRGGTTIYQLSTDGKFVYYYAHLDRYADGLSEGHFAKQGETIAYVGDTGNAGPGNCHLHFSIAVISDPKRYWQGVNINPYPLLRR